MPRKYSNKRRFLRKSQTYRKGKKGNKYVKKPSKRKCTFFIFGDPKYLANACLSKRNDRFKEQVNLIHNKKMMQLA